METYFKAWSLCIGLMKLSAQCDDNAAFGVILAQ